MTIRLENGFEFLKQFQARNDRTEISLFQQYALSPAIDDCLPGGSRDSNGQTLAILFWKQSRGVAGAKELERGNIASGWARKEREVQDTLHITKGHTPPDAPGETHLSPELSCRPLKWLAVLRLPSSRSKRERAILPPLQQRERTLRESSENDF